MRPLACDIALVCESPEEAQAALDLLTAWDRWLYARGCIPPLYAAGVRYAREPAMARSGTLPRVATPHGRAERFDDARTVLARGEGDCDDLAAWRAGELQAQGVRARALLVATTPERWHCVVATPWGVEDPSRTLGM